MSIFNRGKVNENKMVFKKKASNRKNRTHISKLCGYAPITLEETVRYSLIAEMDYDLSKII